MKLARIYFYLSTATSYYVTSTVLAATLLNAVLTLLNERIVCFKLLSLLYSAPYVQALFQKAPSEHVAPILQCCQCSSCLCLCLLPSPRCLLRFLYSAPLGSTCPSDASEKPHLNMCIQFYNAVNVYSTFAFVSSPVQDAYFDVRASNVMLYCFEKPV
jgi:hypothetical protein